MKAPCLNCKDREPLCHSKCERYKEFKQDKAQKDAWLYEKRRNYHHELYYGRKHPKSARKKYKYD